MGHEHLYELASNTDGPAFNTGQRVRQFEVWGTPADRYCHGVTLHLRYPGSFPTVARARSGGGYEIGFVRPDGGFTVTYGPQKSAEEAELARQTYWDGKEGVCAAELRVFPRDGKIVAVVVYYQGITDAGFNFRPTAEEAEALCALRDELTAEWKRRASAWIKAEDARTSAIAHAVAAEGLPANPPALTECLECGATYDQPGHVEAGGMGCDRCNH